MRLADSLGAGAPCRNCLSLDLSPIYSGVVRDGEIVTQFKCPGCQMWGDIDADQFEGRVSIDCPNCEYHGTIPVRVLGWQAPIKGSVAGSTSNGGDDDPD
jgi:hypothetical protein